MYDDFKKSTVIISKLKSFFCETKERKSRKKEKRQMIFNISRAISIF